MKLFCLTYLTFLIITFSYSQTDGKINDLEKQKSKIELKIKNLTDSVGKIDFKIAELKSKEFLDKIKSSSLTAIARNGAKLKNDPNVLAGIITTFSENEKVIILGYKNGYFEVCQGSICGYINEIWIKKNNSISEFIKTQGTDSKSVSNTNDNSPSSSLSLKSSNANNSTYKTKSYRSSKTYYRGPRGGCYYINSNGNKTYVSRSLCN